MKNKWENYSLKDGKVSNSYIREYSCKKRKRRGDANDGRNDGRNDRRDDLGGERSDKQDNSTSSILDLSTVSRQQSESGRKDSNIEQNDESIQEGNKNNVGKKMKASEKKMLVKHIKKDDKEFRGQIKDDVKLKKEIMKSKTEKKK